MATATHRIVSGDDSGIHDEPHVEGRRVTVRQIVGSVEARNLDAETVADNYDLSIADVYRALTYYYDNPEEMGAVEHRREVRESAARERGAKTLDELRR